VPTANLGEEGGRGVPPRTGVYYLLRKTFQKETQTGGKKDQENRRKLYSSEWCVPRPWGYCNNLVTRCSYLNNKHKNEGRKDPGLKSRLVARGERRAVERRGKKKGICVKKSGSEDGGGLEENVQVSRKSSAKSGKERSITNRCLVTEGRQFEKDLHDRYRGLR